MYQANPKRYETMQYRRCGKSGLLLPAISLGFWRNFGGVNTLTNSRALVTHAFDSGITHFDLANNYGPPYGSAEETFGQIMKSDMKPYRDEMIITTKAGYDMWDGPYGNFGSKKYLTASLDQSLRRMGLDYVDIFYHHRPDPDTPLEETMDALMQAVRSGKALYVGISNYQPEQVKEASSIIRSMGGRLLVHQPSYSMFNRWVENGLYDVLDEEGMGAVCFSPLAQGMLTEKYFDGIPADSRAARGLMADPDEDRIAKAKKLREIAVRRGQSLPQMALAWVLRKPTTTSVIIGARTLEQLDDNLKTLDNLAFTEEELREIDTVLQ